MFKNYLFRFYKKRQELRGKSDPKEEMDAERRENI